MMLTITSKEDRHQDAFQKWHSSTSGDLEDDTKVDGRYVLHCPQASGEKTVKLTPKDSWSNVTIEYEPFTFNHFGAKIPLPEFRPTPTGLEGDSAEYLAGITEHPGEGIGVMSDEAAPNKPEVNFFMEVSGYGDYEVRYANPNIKVG